MLSTLSTSHRWCEFWWAFLSGAINPGGTDTFHMRFALFSHFYSPLTKAVRFCLNKNKSQSLLGRNNLFHILCKMGRWRTAHCDAGVCVCAVCLRAQQIVFANTHAVEWFLRRWLIMRKMNIHVPRLESAQKLHDQITVFLWLFLIAQHPTSARHPRLSLSLSHSLSIYKFYSSLKWDACKWVTIGRGDWSCRLHDTKQLHAIFVRYYVWTHDQPAATDILTFNNKWLPRLCSRCRIAHSI